MCFEEIANTSAHKHANSSTCAQNAHCLFHNLDFSADDIDSDRDQITKKKMAVNNNLHPIILIFRKEI